MNRLRIAPSLGERSAQAAQERAITFGIGEAPVLDAIDHANTQKLLETSRYVLAGGRALIEFVDLNRDVARDTGIETIAVELSGIIDSGRLDSVKDTLEESLVDDKSCKVSMEGMTYLRRAERLLSEATRAINGVTGRFPSYSMGSSRSFLGEAASSQNLIILGVVALCALTVLAIVLTRK